MRLKLNNIQFHVEAHLDEMKSTDTQGNMFR